ncbi:unnamed protein product, partial [Laminaria digitata]
MATGLADFSLLPQAKHIRESYNRFRANRDQSITEIHEFVKKVSSIPSRHRA